MEEDSKLPQKRSDGRRQNHSLRQLLTTLQLDYPSRPETYAKWHKHFPAFFDENDEPLPGTDDEKMLSQVEIADVGCGYGGLIVSLSPIYPAKLMLGMEIRIKVEEFVEKRILALRTQNKEKKRDEAGSYQNISVIRMNAMKFLPNFFRKGQLSKMFFLFPDPHFKKKKHKARIITPQLLAEYAYVLRVGGILYTVTDVKDLHEWMVQHLDDHPLFVRLSAEELAADPCIPCVMDETEEGKKVTRNKGDKYLMCYRRIETPQNLPWTGFKPLFQSAEEEKDEKDDNEAPN
ncbi:tRNA (guanine-N(7)-)-methyltransferase (tRNA(m7G46)-methyltransferase) [Dinochytrium kinnereticum]|nr:tRNA (guanine-N(7)-)-methyltransferase (tRNA(m7G46)-methyltransferase) [Dinochytrium kinnereticum]